MALPQGSSKEISGLAPRESIRTDCSQSPESGEEFTSALRQIATAGAVSSRASIEASKATKPSRHTRFVYNPAKGHS